MNKYNYRNYKRGNNQIIFERLRKQQIQIVQRKNDKIKKQKKKKWFDNKQNKHQI